MICMVNTRLRYIRNILSIFLAYKDLIQWSNLKQKASVLKYIWSTFKVQYSFLSQTQYRLVLMRIFCSEEDQKDFMPAVLICSGKWGGWGETIQISRGLVPPQLSCDQLAAHLDLAGACPACPACPATESLCRAVLLPRMGVMAWCWAAQVMSDSLFWRRC